MMQRAIDQCRSPIERDLFSALIASGWEPKEAPAFPQIHRKRFGETQVGFSVNESHVFDGLSYVFDFTFAMYAKDERCWKILANVETDGHDFHERTKEQAKRDRSRDRVIAKHGIAVVRFTGAEVYADAFACADEVEEILAAEVQRRTSRAPLLDEHRDADAYRAARELKTMIADAHQEVSLLRGGDDGNQEEAERLLRDAVRVAARLVG